MRDFIKKISGDLPKRNLKEIIGSTIGALIAIASIAWISQQFVSTKDTPFMVASMGAAAVLLFASPRSKVAQPWPLVAGHIISASVGVACAYWIPNIIFACAFAVSLSIALMSLSYSLHPPGGAAALVAVIGGESIHDLGFSFVLFPVGINVFVMLILALVINNLIAGTRYPFQHHEDH